MGRVRGPRAPVSPARSLDLGVGRGDRVVLMMRNRPEFHVADVAAMLVGATPVSIYNSSSSEQVAFIAGNCGARVAIVEDAAFLATLLEARPQLPDLRHVVVIDDVRAHARRDAVVGAARNARRSISTRPRRSRDPRISRR